jgi:hypothetical protein
VADLPCELVGGGLEAARSEATGGGWGDIMRLESGRLTPLRSMTPRLFSGVEVSKSVRKLKLRSIRSYNVHNTSKPSVHYHSHRAIKYLLCHITARVEGVINNRVYVHTVVSSDSGLPNL